MKTLTGKRSPAQLVALFAAVLCLLSLNTAPGHAQPISGRFTQPHVTLGTCQARYEVVVTHVDGRPMNKVIQFGEFQSQGRGPIPPQAAQRARMNAERCMQTQWNGRQSGMAPSECMDQQRITGYNVQNFQKTLDREICQALKPLSCAQGRAQIRYSIFAVVDGGPGCGTRMSPVSRTPLDSNVMTQCKCRKPMPDRSRFPRPRVRYFIISHAAPWWLGSLFLGPRAMWLRSSIRVGCGRLLMPLVRPPL
jgi:hypothetical protein